MKEPLVSVIIPTYGGNESLMRAVVSAIKQDYTNIEIIVVDDNNPGTDARQRTENIISQFSGQQKITYIQHEANKNGSTARNTGARKSSGEYLAFLDDDDAFLPAKISRQVNYLELHLEFGAAYCWRYEGKKIVGSDLTGDLSACLLDLSFTPCTPSIMIRRECYEALNGFDEGYVRHQDFEFLLRFCREFKMGVVKEPLVRIIGNGVDNQPKGKRAIEIKKRFIDTFTPEIERIDQKTQGFKKKVYANHYSQLILKLLRYGDLGLAIKIYFAEGYKGGLLFWKRFARESMRLIRKRIKGEGIRFDG